jgi:hypothetical protein
VPLFQVVGMLDGTSRVELLTMRGLGNHWEVWLPGAVVWSPTTANEFHLERFERGHELHRPAVSASMQTVFFSAYISPRLSSLTDKENIR